MHPFTTEELHLLLNKLHPHGGYSSDPKIAALQGKLSMLLEVASLRERLAAGQDLTKTENWGL